MRQQLIACLPVCIDYILNTRIGTPHESRCEPLAVRMGCLLDEFNRLCQTQGTHDPHHYVPHLLERTHELHCFSRRYGRYGMSIHRLSSEDGSFVFSPLVFSTVVAADAAAYDPTQQPLPRMPLVVPFTHQNLFYTENRHEITGHRKRKLTKKYGDTFMVRSECDDAVDLLTHCDWIDMGLAPIEPYYCFSMTTDNLFTIRTEDQCINHIEMPRFIQNDANRSELQLFTIADINDRHGQLPSFTRDLVDLFEVRLAFYRARGGNYSSIWAEFASMPGPTLIRQRMEIAVQRHANAAPLPQQTTATNLASHGVRRGGVEK